MVSAENLRRRARQLEEVEGALESVKQLAGKLKAHGLDGAALDDSIRLHASTLADLKRDRFVVSKHYGHADSIVGLGLARDRAKHARAVALQHTRAWRKGGEVDPQEHAPIDRAALSLATALALHRTSTVQQRADAYTMLLHSGATHPKADGDGTPEGASLFERWRAKLNEASKGNGISAEAIVEALTGWDVETLRSDTRRKRRAG